MVLIAHAPKPDLNAHADLPSGVRGLNFGLSLHKHPFLLYASSEDSGESARMRRLASVIAARQCDKYIYRYIVRQSHVLAYF